MKRSFIFVMILVLLGVLFVPVVYAETAEAIIKRAASKEPGCDANLIIAIWRTETGIADCRSRKGDCTSSSNAKGPLQFLEGTWASYAESGWDIWDLTDSTRAACRLVRALRLQEQTNESAFKARFAGTDGGQCWNCGADGVGQAGRVWALWKQRGPSVSSSASASSKVSTPRRQISGGNAGRPSGWSCSAGVPVVKTGLFGIQWTVCVLPSEVQSASAGRSVPSPRPSERAPSPTATPRPSSKEPAVVSPAPPPSVSNGCLNYGSSPRPMLWLYSLDDERMYFESYVMESGVWCFNGASSQTSNGAEIVTFWMVTHKDNENDFRFTDTPP